MWSRSSQGVARIKDTAHDNRGKAAVIMGHPALHPLG